MKIILSRKGFDTGVGGVPSPILDGVPVSMPIPQEDRFGTTYAELGLGDVVEMITRNKITRTAIAHADPAFLNGQVLFGQSGAAQAHLNNQGVETGDIFLFLGLFKDYEDKGSADHAPHHRIFGWMEAERKMSAQDAARAFPDVRHPHFDPQRTASLDTVWVGRGGVAKSACPQLRLTRDGHAPSFWDLPAWIRDAGLSYHAAADRWDATGVRAVARGQEFVIGEHAEAASWVHEIIRACEAEPRVSFDYESF